MHPTVYDHTQRGWLTIATVAIPAASGLGLLFAGALWPGLAFAAVSILIAALFSTLRVRVDADAVRIQFGVGLIRKRFPIAAIRAFQPVRNRWYYGWGIRLIQGGWLYNVSGFDAVELELAGGRRARIGTDDQEGLVRALSVLADASAIGSQANPNAEAVRAMGPGVAGFVVAFVAMTVVGVTALLLVSGREDPAVEMTARDLSVRGGLYSATVPFDAITALDLAPTMPPVTRKTNGYSFGDTRRGTFIVEGLGRGRLFTDNGYPPFVIVRTADSFVIVNFSDAARTRALYEELRRRMP